MKKLLLLLLIVFMTSCKVDTSLDGQIKESLIEYYSPSRKPVSYYSHKFLIEPIIYKNYEYQSHKILKMAKTDNDSTYTIQHKYKVDCVYPLIKSSYKDIEYTDTIDVKFAGFGIYIKDNKIWDYKGLWKRNGFEIKNVLEK